jgi:membrane associated rhomboid family serine protease
MIKGILPTLTAISWEGHLAGLVAGVALGSFMSKLKHEPGAPANPGPVSVPGH